MTREDPLLRHSTKQVHWYTSNPPWPPDNLRTISTRLTGWLTQLDVRPPTFTAPNASTLQPSSSMARLQNPNKRCEQSSSRQTLSSCITAQHAPLPHRYRVVGQAPRVHLEVVLDNRGERLGACLANGVVTQLQRGQILVTAQRLRNSGDALRADVIAADVQQLQAGVAPQRGRKLRPRQLSGSCILAIGYKQHSCKLHLNQSS